MVKTLVSTLASLINLHLLVDLSLIGCCESNYIIIVIII